MPTTGQTQSTTTGPNPSIAAARPAETLTIVGAVAFLIARALGVDNDTTMTALTTVIAFTPAAVTWLVQLFSRGRPQAPATESAIADELKNLNKTVGDAIAAGAPSEPQKSTTDATELVKAVELVLATKAADSEARKSSESFRDDLVEALREFAKGIAEGRSPTVVRRRAAQRTNAK